MSRTIGHKRNNKIGNKDVKRHSKRESRRFIKKQIFFYLTLDKIDIFIDKIKYLKRIRWIYD